jgi:1-acyl-sn-glycerol-3-phosphate acyltransferase
LSRPTSIFIRAWRLGRMVLHIAGGFATLAFVFPKATAQRRNHLIRAWGHQVLRIFAMTLTVEKPHDFDPENGKRLYIGNHISWIDIYALQAVTAARFVAKSELATWPVLGRLMVQSGTVFIERDKRSDTLRINQTIRERLDGGTMIAVFPEGTTTDGRDVLKFHGNLLQAAIDGGAEIAPFCLRYSNAKGHYTDATAYIGDLSFWDSIKLMLREKTLHCELTFFAPLSQDGRNRRELAAAAENMIRERVKGYTPQDR